MQQPLFNGVKVFAATKHEDRARLGETITDWLRQRPNIEIVDKIVTQSSDAEFHCVTITLFYNEPLTKGARVPRPVPGPLTPGPVR